MNGTIVHENLRLGMQSDKLRMLSLNCWGIPFLTKACSFRISAIADELSKGLYDVVALQEIWTEYQYAEIKKKVAKVLPYSHYFYSGVIGTGLCIFSKYQLIDAFLHQFATNGQFYAIAQGDWFAGKGVGYCMIKHPNGIAHVFNVHLHADYPGNLYTELRTLQAYQCAQFVQKITRPGDSVILCGDFNHEETEIGVRALKSVTGLQDAWHSALKKLDRQCFTINSPDNPYIHANETEKRIDFIFHSNGLQCIDYGIDLEGIPGSKHHFSDHKGVRSTFIFTDSSKTGAESKFDKTSPESSIKILQELRDTIAYGRKLAEEYKWNWIIPIWILLLVFIFMPVFSEDGIYFLLPVLSKLSGEIVFLLQIVCIVLSVSYFWNLVILKRIEKNAYFNAMNEIQLKIEMLKDVKNFGKPAL
ncbi:putative neutral sphingomyelinase isoform X2 [Rhopilema esculentum]|uniref:putative neutral sphingomyelinase isoform X2 n=1 Tax=Rhopilema esculentum TaxID=499914 RepID=UPI0031D7A213|eukprot:gene5284-437_t